LLLLIMLFILCGIHAQDMNYATSTIPPALLKNANAVMRMDDNRVVINNPGDITIYRKYAVTILNEAGDDRSELITYYDKFRDIESVDGVLYDANGIKIRSMKKADLMDYGAVSDFELINDSRVKVYNFYARNYPYTVEYTIRIKSKETIDYPDWIPLDHEKLAVENSSMSVECPAAYKLRYRAFNYKDAPVIDSNSITKKYQWSVRQLSALVEVAYQPAWYELTPAVFLAMSDFSFQDYKGDMSTWNDFGNFMYTLNKGRDELPDNIKKVVHSLTDTVTDVHQKIAILYKYLQTSTRYVAVELGIGGWQAFDANYVASNGYGDCKALSNYMHSLLLEAGIPSDCVLVKAGYAETNFLSDFPSTQFNHEIACVPLKTDTVWLECTSPTLPAGYLSGFTSNRDVLLFDENGGKLVHTPDYTAKDNMQTRKIEATIDSVGHLHADIHTVYTGRKEDPWEFRVEDLSKDKMMEYLKQDYADIPSYDILSFNYKKDKKGLLPVMNENIELVADNYANVSGTRIFINPDILNHHKVNLEDLKQRDCDIVLSETYTDVDSVDITIPSGYTIESVSPKIELDTKFGKYISYVELQPGKMIYYRFFQQNSGRFPATDSNIFVDFLKKVEKADYSTVVLVNHSN
jgi:hypothetical protein